MSQGHLNDDEAREYWGKQTPSTGQGNYTPTEQTVRDKLACKNKLFASDEVQVLIDEIDALRAWATGADLPKDWMPPTYRGPMYVA